MVDLHITGTTAVFGIVADPTDHVRAPMVFNPRFAAHGRDAVMVPCHVTPEDLPAFIAGLRAQRNFHGLAVTIPHKMAIMALCDEIGEQGRLVGAVNTIRIDADRRVHGENFDGQGFVAGDAFGVFFDMCLSRVERQGDGTHCCCGRNLFH